MMLFRLIYANDANQKFNGSALLVALVLGIAISPMANAVVPAPDGGYSGQNTAEGQSALLHLAGGTYNTALGWSSLAFNVTGNYNTAVGAGTLLANTGDENTSTGAGALLSNTTANGNTADGAFALFSTTSGDGNTANGAGALSSNTIGNDNTANGVGALSGNTSGGDNVASGFDALSSSITGFANTAIGVNALQNNTTGSGNIALGANAGINVTNAQNNICIGIGGENVSNVCYIGQTFGTVCLAGTPVFINGVGQLGTNTSSRRFKEEIKPMEQVSEALFALKPVTFHYKKGIDPQGIPQFGLVAEEVEAVNSDLVVRDKEGKPYSVRYEAVNAMLLNEFLKAHKKIEEQEVTIMQLKKELRATAANQQKQIEELVTAVQKVNAQLQLSKAQPQTVENTD